MEPVGHDQFLRRQNRIQHFQIDRDALADHGIGPARFRTGMERHFDRIGPRLAGLRHIHGDPDRFPLIDSVAERAVFQRIEDVGIETGFFGDNIIIELVCSMADRHQFGAAGKHILEGGFRFHVHVAAPAFRDPVRDLERVAFAFKDRSRPAAFDLAHVFRGEDLRQRTDRFDLKFRHDVFLLMVIFC